MRKFILLVTTCVIAVFALMFVIPNAPSLKEGKEGKNENRENEAREIAGSIAWWNDLRSNGSTGVFNPQDMYAAMEQANALGGTRDITIQWDEAGPDNVGGRTRAVLWDKNHPGVVFAGGVAGGLWKSVNNGDSWTRVQGDFSVNTVSCIAQASNGDIYFGTGEGFFDLSLNVPTGFSAPGFPGKGIWKSKDDGNTWTHLASTTPTLANSVITDWEFVQKIACSPNDSNRLYAATHKGLKISTDGGDSWIAATGTNNTTYAYDVKTGSDGRVYAIVGNQYCRSTDPDGNVFENRQGDGGYIAGATGRSEIAVSPSNPLYVYSVISELGSGGGLAGIYKSTDGGLNWTLIGPGNGVSFNPLGFQGWYNIAPAVLPSDPDVLFVGGQFSLFKYTPSLGWYSVSNWFANFFDLSLYIHADMHTIAFNPFNSDEFIIGTDGGVFHTINASATYPTFGSLDRQYNVTQCYGVAAKRTGEIIMGCQDNGVQYIDFQGNTLKAAREIAGGDGFDVSISTTNQSAFFEEYYSGRLTRSSNNGLAFNSFFDSRIDPDANGAPNDGFDGGADWCAPFTLWEAGDGSHSFFTLGTGYSSGHAWITLGALDFATTPDWFRLPATSGVVTCTAFSPDGDNLFVGTSSGTLYRYGNLNQVWAENKFRYPAINSTADSWHAADSGVKVSSKLIASGRYLRSVAVDPHDPSQVVVTAARYGYTTYVWRSINALDSIMTFTDITYDLPKMPVWSSAIDFVNPNLILIGTDLGVYSRDMVNGSGWEEQNAGMDRVPVLQVIQVPYYNETNYTYIATHGRGIFHSASLVGITDVKNNVVTDISLFPNPARDQATLQVNTRQSGDLFIRIYDLNGKEVYHQMKQKEIAGGHAYTIPVNNLQSGTYLVNVLAGSSSASHKMVVIK